MPPEAMESVIRGIGRKPWQRTTLYTPAAPERAAASYGALALAPLVNRPAAKYANIAAAE
jgi:FO synthase